MKRTKLLIAVLGLFLLAQTARADWTAAKRLTWTSGFSFGPAVAIDSSDSIHIVWFDSTPGNYQIFYKRSTDGGTSWSVNQRLTWSSVDCSDPAIALDSGDSLHVVWYDDMPGNNEIYYKKSTNGGTSWSPAKRLTWTLGSSTVPAIAVDSSDAVHIVWLENISGNDEIYSKNSSDGGTTWTAAKRLTWTSSDSRNPALAIDSSDIIYAVWDDPLPGNGEIYGKRSTDGGVTWSSVRRLTWTSGWSYAPDIAIAPPNTIHLVWGAEIPGDTEIFYKGSTDGGTTWSAAKQLTWNSEASGSVSVATDSGNAVHIVWMDSTPGDPEIYYRKSGDGGTTWAASQRLTWTSGNSYFPVLAIDSTNTAHVVWRDDLSGNIEIYYKNGN
jgi:hypothetical protein